MNMRRQLFFIGMCLVASFARAENPLVTGAQEAYAKGEYAKALALYDSVNAEQSSAALLFNIGNCHMKLGDVPHAVLYFERASRLQPGAEDIQALSLIHI